MKKIKVLVMALMCVALLLAGCGNLNENIKLTATSERTADFFFNYINEVTYVEYIAFSNASQTETRASLNQFFNIIFDSLNDSIAISCAVDFCAGVRDGTESSSSKLYENLPQNGGSKQFIRVKKKSKKDSVFETELYSCTRDSEFADVVNSYTPTNYSFTIVPDNNSNKFTISYTLDGGKCSAVVEYNANNGLYNIEINRYNSLLSENAIETKIELCNYKNNTEGARCTVAYQATDGSQRNLIFEYLNKDYYQRAKFGYIKDSSQYVKLTATEEENIGAVNSGDDYGYSVVYNNQPDAQEGSASERSLEPYGIFPAE